VTDNPDRVYLLYILESISNIEEISLLTREKLDTDEYKHQRAALLYYLQTMAEATQRLSDELKSRHTEVDWLGIAGFRNRLAHGYLEINMKFYGV
jgi:uncharacterized protein with HEPN domain